MFEALLIIAIFAVFWFSLGLFAVIVLRFYNAQTDYTLTFLGGPISLIVIVAILIVVYTDVMLEWFRRRKR